MTEIRFRPNKAESEKIEAFMKKLNITSITQALRTIIKLFFDDFVDLENNISESVATKTSRKVSSPKTEKKHNKLDGFLKPEGKMTS